MFSGYLRFRERCAVCDANFQAADAGDGPAVFVILAVGAIVAPLLIILQAVNLPDWMALTIALLATIALCLAFLPPFKATLFALQWKHKAREATFSSPASGGGGERSEPEGESLVAGAHRPLSHRASRDDSSPEDGGAQ